MDTYRFGIPVTKVDKDARTVTGRCTVEALDTDGEVMDYETIKGVLARTWPGNIREMHAPVAVGTGVIVKCDDENKAIEISATVSKGAPNTWEKVLDGTLKAFSVGGKALRRVAEKMGDKTVKRLYMETVNEISLVDAGACPGTGFAIAKMAQTDAGEPFAEAVADDTAIVKVEPPAAVDPVVEPPAAKADAGASDDKHKTASGKEGKHYAGVDGKSFPITDPEDVENASRAIGRAPAGDRAKTKANIIRIAYEEGSAFVAKLPDPWKKPGDRKDAGKARAALVAKLAGLSHEELIEAVRKFAPEPWDVSLACRVVADCNALMASEMFEANSESAEGGAEGAKDENGQIAMLKEAIQALVQFLASEIAEQYASLNADDQASVDALELPELDTPDVAMARTARIVKFALSLIATTADVEKAGARHSKVDLGMIQDIHDTSAKLGAMCADNERQPDDKSKAGESDEEKARKVAKRDDACAACEGKGGSCEACLGSGSLKISKALGELKTTATASAATIETLTKRVKDLEDSPASGGPAAHPSDPSKVVEKMFGGQTDGTTEIPVGIMNDAFKMLAAEANSEQDRQTIATLAISAIHKRNRTGAVASK